MFVFGLRKTIQLKLLLFNGNLNQQQSWFKHYSRGQLIEDLSGFFFFWVFNSKMRRNLNPQPYNILYL